MFNLKKVYLIFFLAIALTLILGNFALAEGNGEALEIKYPDAFGDAPTSTKTALPDYVKYIFRFSITIAGLVAFGALIYGGFSYLTSTGSPAKIADSKDRITAAFLGLIILLCSFLLLYTINPELTVMNITKKPVCNCKLPPEEWTGKCKEYCERLTNPMKDLGAYLMTDDYKEGLCFPYVGKSECLRLTIDVDDLNVYNFDDKLKKIKFVNDEENRFWAILHENPNHEGQCKIFSGESAEEFQNIQGKTELGEVDGVSSVTIFKKRSEIESKTIKICDKPDYMGDCHSYYTTFDTPRNVPAAFNDNVNSIKLDDPNTLVVLFEHPVDDTNFPGKCAVFRGSYSDMKNNPIGRCFNPGLSFHWWKSCVSAIAIYPLK